MKNTQPIDRAISSPDKTCLLWACLLALLIGGGFCYTVGAAPGTSLLLDVVLLLVGILALAIIRGGRRNADHLVSFLDTLKWPPLAVCALACDAFARWSQLPIRHAGQPL